MEDVRVQALFSLEMEELMSNECFGGQKRVMEKLQKFLKSINQLSQCSDKRKKSSIFKIGILNII